MKKVLRFMCVFFIFFVITACGVNTNQIRRMQSLEEGVDSPTTIEELTTAIGKFQKRAEDLINTDIRLGTWYKIVGTRYLDNRMYGKALENFRMAIDYYPTNQNLFYYVGVCAGYMAKASLDFDAKGNELESKRYYALAESAYKRAIEIEPRYERALYGLSILYVFEFDTPAKAIPYLELIMDIEKRNLDAMFVLARAYYSTGNYEGSVALYDRIIETTKDKNRKAEAESNKSTVLALMYGPN
ncbi:MAG TPA: DUF2225 domain-containing protein [Treponemataceae bacterium]|nr:DUF2225 domain-containing protein [Treponemataceae bacterium]